MTENSSMNTIGSRLKFARELRGLTLSALAAKVRTPITPGAISHIESGRSESSRYLVWIAAALSVRPEWLVTGTGSMFDDWPFPEIDRTALASLDPAELEEINSYISFKLQRSANKSQTTDRSIPNGTSG